MRLVRWLLVCFSLTLAIAGHADETPDCNRTFTLALHEHGLLYSSDTGTGIDKDIADELIRRSGCKVAVSLMPRSRIWQLIESGALDFSLSGITNAERDRFAFFAWYVSNKYYLLVRKDAGVLKHSEFERNAKLKLGVIRSFRYSISANGLVDRLTAEGRVANASGLAPLYQLLLANQIQAMIIEPFDYPAIAGSDIRDLTQTLEFGDDPVLHGLIMSKTALSATQQMKWHSLIDAMRADGTVLRIFEKYFAPELARVMVNF